MLVKPEMVDPNGKLFKGNDMIRKRLVLLIAIGLIIVGAAVVFMPKGGHRPRLDDASARPEIETESLQQNEEHPEQMAAAESLAAEPKVLFTATTPGESTTWSRFRGPNGTGVSQETNIPVEWSDTKNLLWKTKLPGAGSSSPVLSDKFVFLTTYAGYGEDKSNVGSISQLKRSLVCISRGDGKIVWTRDVEAVQPEDRYQGMGVPEHGYATNSPVTDGQRVFAFLGKSGVFAFDLEGNQLWKVSVGTESGNRGWGTAASLMLYKDLLIVNAAEESHSIIALSKATGEVVWKSEASTLELSYGTPAVVNVSESRDDLVIAVPGELWGLNPTSGKLSWFAQTTMTDNLSPSVIVDGKVVYAFGGYRSSGSMAFEVGGKGDVTKTGVLWTSRTSSYVATPALFDGRLYWIDDKGMYFCVDAKTGTLVHRARTPGISSGDRPVYASPVVVNGKIYAQTRTSGLYVIEPSDELKVVAQNKFESDDSLFNATPAVDRGQLYLRSYKYLYCVGSKPDA